MGIEVGDRVRLKTISFASALIGAGREGVVAIISPEYVGVQFDKPLPVGGHDLGGQKPNYPVFKDKHCRWGPESELEVIGHGEPPQPVGYHRFPGEDVGSGSLFPSGLRPVKDPDLE